MSLDFSAFFGKISAGLSKQYFTCPSKPFDENDLLLNKVLSFSEFNEKIVAFCRKLFGPVNKTDISLSVRKLWRISILWEKNHHFRTFCDKSSAFCQKNNWGCQNSIVTVHMIFLINYVFEKKLLIFFGHSEVTFWLFVQNLWADLSKLHSTCRWKI